jgi:hypothetical protein
VHQGGCLCGQVRFRIEAEPVSAARCYCQTCQKLSGGGHTENITFRADAVQVTGAYATFVWTGDKDGTVTTCFCPTCGSPLFGNGAHAPEYRFVRVGALDDPSVYEPRLMVFARSRQSWDNGGEGVPAFETTPPREGWSPPDAG